MIFNLFLRLPWVVVKALINILLEAIHIWIVFRNH